MHLLDRWPQFKIFKKELHLPSPFTKTGDLFSYMKLGFLRGGALTAIFRGGAGYFWGGAGYFFFFDEVKMKHFVFFREF